MKHTALILKHEKLEKGYFLLTIERPVGLHQIEAGQFAMLKIPHFFLRRPLTFFEINENSLSFCYKPLGAGLESLTKVKAGHYLEFHGPLGTPEHFHPEHLIFLSDDPYAPALHALATHYQKKILPMNTPTLPQDTVVVAAIGQTMGCGVGSCMSCVSKNAQGEVIKLCQTGLFTKKESCHETKNF